MKWNEALLKPVTKDLDRPLMLSDLEIVRLTNDFECPAGRIPTGTQGTILQIYDDGAAYMVEFEEPWDMPETVPAAFLKPDVQPS